MRREHVYAHIHTLVPLFPSLSSFPFRFLRGWSRRSPGEIGAVASAKHQRGSRLVWARRAQTSADGRGGGVADNRQAVTSRASAAPSNGAFLCNAPLNFSQTPVPPPRRLPPKRDFGASKKEHPFPLRRCPQITHQIPHLLDGDHLLQPFRHQRTIRSRKLLQIAAKHRLLGPARSAQRQTVGRFRRNDPG